MHRSPAPPGPAHGIRYQPALDGLRGVAVLAVLAYHASLPFARGGFLGVDLFFVLSGYLITTILVAEWGSTGGIDLGRFWVRRARRLLPALLLLLAAVAVYAGLVADSAASDRLRADGLATLAYVANWQQILAEVSYFEQFQDPSPLKHAWSLGIEEQYYLVWPLLMLGALVLLARPGRPAAGGAPSRAARRLGWLAVVTLLAAAASAVLMAALHAPGTDPSRVYYGTDTRAQAILVGAALALLLAWRAAMHPAGGPDPAPDPAPEGASRWARLASPLVDWAGIGALALLAVAVAFVRDRDDRMYQGGLLVVAIAAAAVIAAAVRDRGPVRRVLAVRPLRLVGVISYGLYLWHWPVYVLLTPDRTGWSGGPLLAARLALTFAAALASFVLLERPIRRGSALAGRGLVAATGAITATACLLVLGTTGARAALPGTALATASGESLPGAGTPLGDPGAVVAPGVLAGPVLRGGDDPGGRAAPRPPSADVPGGREVRVFLGGDSVALTLAVNLTERMQAAAGMRVRAAVQLGCGVARARNVVDGQPAPQAPGCTRWPQLWVQRLQNFDADVAVVFIGAWEVFDKYELGRELDVGTPEYEAYLQRELDFAVATLTGQGVGRVLLTNVPCFKAPERGLAGEEEPRNDPARGAWLNQVLDRFADRYPGVVSILDLRGFLCRGPDGSRYVDRLGGVEVRSDGVHFTPGGAELVWDWLVPRIEAAARPRTHRTPAGGASTGGASTGGASTSGARTGGDRGAGGTAGEAP